MADADGRSERDSRSSAGPLGHRAILQPRPDGSRYAYHQMGWICRESGRIRCSFLVHLAARGDAYGSATALALGSGLGGAGGLGHGAESLARPECRRLYWYRQQRLRWFATVEYARRRFLHDEREHAQYRGESHLIFVRSDWPEFVNRYGVL